jgi:hypothetical protein
MIDSPVLFIIFNRPDVTALVFNEIKKAQPKQLFIAADGPRLNRSSDIRLCNETRNIVNHIDWPCEVKTLFRAQNLGCGKAVSSAITWFFEHVEQGIILEDDCLPSPSFFIYCQNLLNYYKDDERIMHIGGVNFQNGNIRSNGSYYFSAITHVWGWASWRRAWKKYDFNVRDFYLFVRERKINNYFENSNLANHILEMFKSVHYHEIDTWDHQWTFTIQNNGGLSIIPNTNLISNLGFREDATHTKSTNSIYANLIIDEIKLPLSHPNEIKINKEADFYFYNKVENLELDRKNLLIRLLKKLKNKIINNLTYLLKRFSSIKRNEES